MLLPTKRRRRKLGLRRRRTKVGAEPGLLTPDPAAHPTRLEILAYSEADLVEQRLQSVAQVERHRGRWPVMWVNVVGLRDVPVIESLGQLFGLHPLALEDVLNVHQRPKVEEYRDHYYIVTRLPSYEAELGSEQISLFLGEGFVITFQEREGDCFEPVRHRLRQGKLRIRGAGPDYLAYALIDAVVDAYFPVLEQLTERLEVVEARVVESPSADVVRDIADVKHELMALRRMVWPLRDAMATLQRGESRLIAPETRVYIRDCYDHTVHLIELSETYRELAGGLLDSYMTSISIRTGEVTKILTIIATVFIPLTFIAGIYGMNFNRSSPYNLPELDWRYGYPMVLGVMGMVTLVMVLFFWRRGWIGRGSAAPPPSRARPSATDEHEP